MPTTYRPRPGAAGTCHGCNRRFSEVRHMIGKPRHLFCPACIAAYLRGDLLPRERARVQLAYLGHLPMTGGPA